MVAISLYRGNLHRVPDVPRRWVMPRPTISLKEFRGLLRRRSKAICLLYAGDALPSSSAPSTIANANTPPPQPSLPPLQPPPLLPPPQQQKIPDQQIEEGVVNHGVPILSSPERLVVDNIEGIVNLEDRKEEEVGGASGSCADCAVEEVTNLMSLVQGKVKLEAEKESDSTGNHGTVGHAEDLQVGKYKVKEEEEEKKNEDPDPDPEGDRKLGTPDEKEKRKKQVEEKLEILNKKKHNLVQALKMILSAEEELKRRSCMQPTRPSVPLQVDVSNDSGSMTRAATPRMGTEAHVGGNTEGGEADDALNPNLQSRQVHRMSNMSPSAESALKRQPYFQHNAASHPSRSSALAAGSPLRFAFPGNQAQPSNLPPVSVSGTNTVVSSPSPAASVGTSRFRDARNPSPWR